MRNKRFLSSAMAVVMTLSTFSPVMAATPDPVNELYKQQLMQSVVDNDRQYSIERDPIFQAKQASEQVRVIVELNDKPVIDQAIAQGVRLEDMNKSIQANLAQELTGKMDAVQSEISNQKINAVYHYEFVNVFNGFSATMTKADAEKVSEMSGVKRVVLSAEFERPEYEIVTPDMNTSGGIIKTPETWNLSLKGEGMVVAVMDSSFDPTHPSMQTIVRQNKAPIKSQADIPAGLPGTFRNLKMPYAYNYYDNTQNLASDSDHGTHVAGTVAASGDPSQGQIRGVAPEAQVLGMKVFGDDPSISTTYDDIYVRAIEDAIVLGADVVNMSLGSTGAFVVDEENDPARVAIRKAAESGIIVNVSAGNSNKFGSGHADPYVTNPDMGVVGSPSVNPETFSIASVENTHVAAPQLTSPAGSFGYMVSGKIDPTVAFNGVATPYEFCGLGQETDFVNADGTKKDLTGKIALIQRGAIGFGVKIFNAQNAGAAGVIIFNSTAGGDALMGMSYGDQEALIKIPAAFLGITDGTKLKDAAEKTVTFTNVMTSVKNVNSGKMSNFTSWGTTPNLDFKPELTAPGGQIYSTLQGGKYGLMSGTSMAAPHAAGGSALILQRVDEEFGLTGKARFEFGKDLMMSTAVPLVGNYGKEISNPVVEAALAPFNEFVSPRRQGAGVMDLYAAATTNVIAVDPSTNLSKVALKEIQSPLVSYNVEVRNLGTTPITYKIKSSIATDFILNGRITGASQPIKDAVITFASEGAPVTTLTVPAKSSKVLTVNMDLTNIKAANVDGKLVPTYMPFTQLFSNGGFVEGFLRLEDVADNTPEIGLPYMGFYGDWNQGKILDRSLFEGTGFYGAGYNGVYTETAPTATSPAGSPFLGFTFDGKKDKNLIAISPNGDGNGDYMGSWFTFIRNAKELQVNILDKDGNVVREISKQSYVRKNFFDGKATNPKARDFGSWDGMINNEIVEGSYTYQIKAKIDFPGKEWQVYNFPVQVDNTAPTVDSIVYDKVAKTVTVKATDGFKVKNYALLINGELFKPAAATESISGVFNVGDKVTEGTALVAGAFDYSYNLGMNQTVVPVTPPVVVIVDDKTAPAVDMTTPAAFSTLKNNAVAFTGKITDPTGLKSLTIGGNNVSFTYDEVAKVYNFTTVIDFADGKHGVKVVATDLADNKREFERKIYVDGTAPTITFDSEIMKSVPNDTKAYLFKGVFGDNYLGATLTINGSLVDSVTNDENKTPITPVSKAFSYSVPLREGNNVVTIELVDGAGTKVVKAYDIYRLKAGEVSNLINADITPGDKVSTENPVQIKLSANKATDWNVTIVDPLGNDVINYKESGLNFSKTWAPEAGRKLNGEYQVIVKYTQLGVEKTEIHKFSVYNYPILVNDVAVVKRNGYVSVEADISNLSAATQNPMLVVQVTNDKGQVINISTAKIKNLQSKQEVTLSSGFGTPSNGTYKVEVFVWTGWDNAKSLAGKVTKNFIVE